MTKVLFILAAVLMAISCFFNYQNGRALTTMRQESQSNHRLINTELAGVSKLVEEITSKNTQIAEVVGKVDVETEKLKSINLKIAAADDELKRIAESVKTKEATMAQLKAQLAKLPAGFNLQTLTEDLNKMKAQIVDFQTQAEAKKKEVAGEQEKLDLASKALADVINKIETRKKAFERNAMSGRVVAVNGDWGFVVLDVGEKESITPDTKLIVIRGTETVGKLSILSVNGQKTVANILTDTLAAGMSPAPGDRVILENLVQ
jgi:peptidoglycan hydrolase CwlO-like protein